MNLRRTNSHSAGERGIALFVAILLLLVITVMGVALLFTASIEQTLSGTETRISKIFYAADSGIEYAAGMLNSTLNYNGSNPMPVGVSSHYPGGGAADMVVTIAPPVLLGYSHPAGLRAPVRRVGLRKRPGRRERLCPDVLGALDEDRSQQDHRRRHRRVSEAPDRSGMRKKMISRLRVLPSLLLVLLTAIPAGADDKDFLRPVGDKVPPNLLIVFGNSQTMTQTISFTGTATSTWDGDGDSPASKLGSAKRVIKQFVTDYGADYNIGLTTFSHNPNAGSIDIDQKHWIYEALDVDFPERAVRGAGRDPLALGSIRRRPLHEQDRSGLHGPVTSNPARLQRQCRRVVFRPPRERARLHLPQWKREQRHPAHPAHDDRRRVRRRLHGRHALDSRDRRHPLDRGPERVPAEGLAETGRPRRRRPAEIPARSWFATGPRWPFRRNSSTPRRPRSPVRRSGF